MKIINIFLLRDFFEIKRNIISFLIILSLFPMLLHLLIVIPFSLVLNNFTEIRYLNWSVIGIWTVSASFIAFILPLSKMKRIKFDSLQLQTVIKAPISNFQISSSIIISTMIISSLEIIIAMAFTTLVNNQYLNSLDYIIIFSQIIPIIIFFSVVSMIIGQFVHRNLNLASISVGVFLFISFGLGSFIPVDAYPESVIQIIKLLPISGLINNGQLILFNQAISFYYFIVSMVLNAILFAMLLVIVHKTYRD